jgi:hypothetical protein
MAAKKERRENVELYFTTHVLNGTGLLIFIVILILVVINFENSFSQGRIWTKMIHITSPYLANLLSRVLVKSQCFSYNELLSEIS